MKKKNDEQVRFDEMDETAGKKNHMSGVRKSIKRMEHKRERHHIRQELHNLLENYDEDFDFDENNERIRKWK